MITRRQFIMGSLAFGGLATSAFGKTSNLASMPISEGYGALVADPQKLLDLPKGFSYKVISSLGNAMSDGIHKIFIYFKFTNRKYFQVCEAGIARTEIIN